MVNQPKSSAIYLLDSKILKNPDKGRQIVFYVKKSGTLLNPRKPIQDKSVNMLGEWPPSSNSAHKFQNIFFLLESIC